jgi:DNA-binding transcriptional MerR regulator
MASEEKTHVERKKLIDILAETSQVTGVPADQIISNSKRALFIKARSFFARAAKAEGYNLSDIGEALHKSHSCVINYLAAKEPKPKPQGGPKDMTKEQVRAAVAKLDKEERKQLVQEIAETSDKGERDHLAEFFSVVETKAPPAPAVEKDADRGAAGGQIQEEAKPKKSGGFMGWS